MWKMDRFNEFLWYNSHQATKEIEEQYKTVVIKYDLARSRF